jgi:hypothetical protein
VGKNAKRKAMKNCFKIPQKHSCKWLKQIHAEPENSPTPITFQIKLNAMCTDQFETLKYS